MFQKGREPTGLMHQEPAFGLILVGEFGPPFPHFSFFPLYIPLLATL